MRGIEERERVRKGRNEGGERKRNRPAKRSLKNISHFIWNITKKVSSLHPVRTGSTNSRNDSGDRNTGKTSASQRADDI